MGLTHIRVSNEFDLGAFPHVEIGKVRFRTIRGLCLAWHFICATRRLGGNAKHSNGNRF